MTLIASLLFLVALAASVFAVCVTLKNALPRINEVIAEEFAPVMKTERRISFGPVKQRTAQRSADVIFLRPVLMGQEFKLAA